MAVPKRSNKLRGTLNSNILITRVCNSQVLISTSHFLFMIEVITQQKAIGIINREVCEMQEQSQIYFQKKILEPIPFSGSTAYRQHYQRHPTQAAILNPELYTLAAPQMPVISPPQYIPFEGESTYKASYRNSDIMDKMRILNSEKINRKDYWKQRQVPFVGSSSYKASFLPFDVQIRPQHPTGRQPQTIRFQGKSTYSSDFEGFKVQPQKKCDVNYLPVPYKNTVSNNSHIYYDAYANKFT